MDQSAPGSKDKKREGTGQRREVKTIEYLGTHDESIHQELSIDLISPKSGKRSLKRDRSSRAN